MNYNQQKCNLSKHQVVEILILVKGKKIKVILMIKKYKKIEMN